MGNGVNGTLKQVVQTAVGNQGLVAVGRQAVGCQVVVAVSRQVVVAVVVGKQAVA